MAVEKLRIPDCRETIVFRGLVDIIRNDPHLKTVVKPSSIKCWDGSAGDSSTETKAMLPSLRFTPGAGDGGWEAVGLHHESLIILVDLAVEGTNADNMMNLWGAIRSALFPQNNPEQERKIAERYNQLLIGRPILARPGFNFDIANVDFKAIYAKGLIAVPLLIPT